MNLGHQLQICKNSTPMRTSHRSSPSDATLPSPCLFSHCFRSESTRGSLFCWEFPSTQPWSCGRPLVVWRAVKNYSVRHLQFPPPELDNADSSLNNSVQWWMLWLALHVLLFPPQLLDPTRIHVYVNISRTTFFCATFPNMTSNPWQAGVAAWILDQSVCSNLIRQWKQLAFRLRRGFSPLPRWFQQCWSAPHFLNCGFQFSNHFPAAASIRSLPSPISFTLLWIMNPSCSLDLLFLPALDDCQKKSNLGPYLTEFRIWQGLALGRRAPFLLFGTFRERENSKTDASLLDPCWLNENPTPDLNWD